MNDTAKTCDGPECSRQPKVKGLCRGHYEQQRRGIQLTPLRLRSPNPAHRDEQGRKQCASCRSWVAEGEFPRMKTSLDGLNPSCTRCKVLSPFGLNRVTFAALLVVQGGGCAICGGQSTDGRNFHVDHDHACCPAGRSCGRCVRGLLCNGCNVGIGMLGDDAARLRKAADYLGASRR